MALWTPSQIGPARWFDFSNSSTVTTVSNAISQINDLSGNGGHLSQATSGSRPAYTLAQQNGLNVATFDGSDDFLAFASDFSLGTAHSIFWIGKTSSTITTASAAKALWSGGSYVYPSTTTSDFVWATGSLTSRLTNERLSSIAVAFGSGAADVWGYAKTNTDISGGFLTSTAFTTVSNAFRGRFNGSVDYATASSIGSYNSTNTRYPTILRSLGNRFTYSANYWDGEVWETIVFDKYLSQSETELVEGYLAWKWGLEANLPAGHPYKSSAPTISPYAVNGKEPIAAWIPSRDTAGNGTTTLTDLVGSNDGTLTNMDAATDWVADTDAGGIRALDFDGSNDHILYPAGAYETTFNSNIFTISIWCYVRSFTNSPVIFVYQLISNNDSALIEWGSSGSTLYVKTANNAVGLSGARTYTVSPAVQANSWCHIVFSKTNAGDNGNVWVNGTLQSSYSGSFGTATVTSSHRKKLAIYGTASVPLNGRLDDYRLFDQALDATDIAYLYDSGNGRGIIVESPSIPSVIYHPFASLKHPLTF
jgi:hypothetical protein